MAIEVSCPSCGEEFRVRSDAAGKAFKCKLCGTVVRVPAAAPEDEYDERPPSPRRRRSDDDDDDEDEEERRPRRKKRRSSGGTSTLGPAIGLYVAAGMALAFELTYLVFTMVVINQKPPEIPQKDMAAFLAILYGMQGIFPIYNLMILTGAFCLQTRRAYPMAWIGCILASVPCCSPLYIAGMPFGIWGIVLLCDEDVRRSF